MEWLSTEMLRPASVRPDGDRALDSAFARYSHGLRAVILLAGSVRETIFGTEIGRSILDLPVGEGRSVLDLWSEQVSGLGGATLDGRLALRVLVNEGAKLPSLSSRRFPLERSVEVDPSELRGTGGLLRDLTSSYDADDLVLVVNANQVPLVNVPEVTDELSGAMGDMALAVGPEGVPAGLKLIRCGVLQSIKPKGFVDFKEQALPAIAKQHDVRVVSMERSPTATIRSFRDYLKALRLRATLAGSGGQADPFVEEWSPAFSIVEDGATVHESATLHDSVVLRGGRVGPGAVLARSLVCPSAKVGAREVACDRLIGSNGVRAAEPAR